MNSKAMLNAYPDSLGGSLGAAADLLARPELQGAFGSFYILPSVFDSDLDRGFSIISYDLNRRLADKELSVTCTPAAKDLILDAAYDPLYGARPLRRAIQNQVEDVVAEQMLEGQLKSGDTARICLRDGKVVITKDAAEAAAPAEPPAEDAKTPVEK